MNHSNIPFIIYTHSTYFDVLDVFFTQHEQFASNVKNIVIFSDKKYKDYPNQVIYDNSMSYSERLLFCLKKLDTRTCFFLHEDMFLYDYPDFCEIDLCIAKVNKGELDFVKLIGGTDMDYIPISKNLYQIGEKSLWTFSIQPTIWNIDKFCQILSCHENKNIWELEEAAQETCKQLKIKGAACFDNKIKRGLYHYDNAIYPYIATAICKGKWNIIEYKNLILILKNCKIKIKDRGIFKSPSKSIIFPIRNLIRRVIKRIFQYK